MSESRKGITSGPLVAFQRHSYPRAMQLKKYTFGMSESRRGMTSGAETATNVPCTSTNNRRTIRPATNILNPPLDSAGVPFGLCRHPRPPGEPPPPVPLLHANTQTWRRGEEGDPPKNQGRQQNPKSPKIQGYRKTRVPKIQGYHKARGPYTQKSEDPRVA